MTQGSGSSNVPRWHYVLPMPSGSPYVLCSHHNSAALPALGHKLHGSLPATPQVKSALRLGVGPPPPARSPTAVWEHLAKNRSHSEQWVVALLWWGVVCAWSYISGSALSPGRRGGPVQHRASA